MIALGAKLVADDQVWLVQTAEGIQLHPPDTLKGKIEARQLGILECAFEPHALLTLVIALDKNEPERLPYGKTIQVGGEKIDLIYGANVPNLASALMVRFHKR